MGKLDKFGYRKLSIIECLEQTKTLNSKHSVSAPHLLPEFFKFF